MQAEAIQRGHFIVVEGLEGAGKTTALTTIKRVLADRVPELIRTREPGGTVVGEAVRQLIKEETENEPLDARAELLLFYAARVQLLECVIKPALQRGCWVLADRFELSTIAYQGGGRHLDQEMIRHLSSFCVEPIKPDLIIFLDVPPDQGLRRVDNRGVRDRIEQEAMVFFNEVYQCYHETLRHMENVVMIDATKPLDIVQGFIRSEVEHYMNKNDNLFR